MLRPRLRLIQQSLGRNQLNDKPAGGRGLRCQNTDAFQLAAASRNTVQRGRLVIATQYVRGLLIKRDCDFLN